MTDLPTEGHLYILQGIRIALEYLQRPVTCRGAFGDRHCNGFRYHREKELEDFLKGECDER